MHSVFFEPDGPDGFMSTKSTIGPWNAAAQHGGPPSALAAHLLQAHQAAGNQRLASVTVDILRPVPVARLTTRTRVVRPGRRVALLETVLEAGGQEVLRARGWRIEVAAEPVPETEPGGAPPAVPPRQPPVTFAGAVMDGYLSAMEWRYVAGGGFDQPGPAAAWVRPTIALLPGQELSPMSRALLIADSANGLGSVLDPARFLFLNVDLTVVLHRDPVGDWLLLDASTSVGRAGTGLATSTLSDTAGPCGRGMQTLLVARRG